MGRSYKINNDLIATDHGAAYRIVTSNRYKFSIFCGIKNLPTHEDWIRDINRYIKFEGNLEHNYILTASAALIKVTADKIIRDYCE